MTISDELVVPIPNDYEDSGQLYSKWVFWYLIPNGGGSSTHWSVYLHPLHSFDTSEGFVRLQNSVEKPSKLLKGCRYYVFHEGIRPLWEDPNVKGGQIVYVEVEKSPSKEQEINEKWSETVFSMIGGELQEFKVIKGIEFNSRSTTWKIGMWFECNAPSIQDIRSHFSSIWEGYAVEICDIMQE